MDNNTDKKYDKFEILEFAEKSIEHFILSKQGYCGEISNLDKIKIRQTIATFSKVIK